MKHFDSSWICHHSFTTTSCCCFTRVVSNFIAEVKAIDIDLTTQPSHIRTTPKPCSTFNGSSLRMCLFHPQNEPSILLKASLAKSLSSFRNHCYHWNIQARTEYMRSWSGYGTKLWGPKRAQNKTTISCLCFLRIYTYIHPHVFSTIMYIQPCILADVLRRRSRR